MELRVLLSIVTAAVCAKALPQPIANAIYFHLGGLSVYPKGVIR
jgi:hypothetical protein